MTPRLKVIRRLVTRTSYVLLVEALMRSIAGPVTVLTDEIYLQLFWVIKQQKNISTWNNECGPIKLPFSKSVSIRRIRLSNQH